ncbi:unnamed protein product [Trifolium pratense]|uniref:Uncharacterized protein n=1 Tax=Trifolium pratense TaxID=57577 RepID=A0ACB0KHR4_TRIPR|nr:unnamed protein product [Trifolium pratense]
MAYLSSGASQIIHARISKYQLNLRTTAGVKKNEMVNKIVAKGKYSHSGSNGIVAKTSNMEMRPIWYSGINHRISKHQLKLWTIAAVKKDKMVNKIVEEFKGEGEKPLSTNAPRSKYDVFVNFRGKDIRKGFLSHLIKAFPRKQISFFVDNKIKRGDKLSHSLVEAIEGSFISLIIFSENYASSHWCLDELVKIFECKKKYGQIVIPVFFNVETTVVKRQTKSYEKAFSEHNEKYSPSRVQNWKHALQKSTKLTGIKLSDFQNEAELLEEIINVVSKSLSKHPVNSKGLVGIDKPIEHLESLLRKGSKKVRVIGICGMGGIGKTTIAEEIFCRNRSKYDGGCFLPKVSEELTRHGLQSLKENLFSTLLEEDVKIDPLKRLASDIVRRVGRMKVLIVLDDVKDKHLLKMLFGTLEWFRSDSRIVITTRDKQVLIANGVDDHDLYEVGVLSFNQALELFYLNAFKQINQTEKEKYYKLSKRFVDYAKCIPLVLEILGSHLIGKDMEFWKSQLYQLKRKPIKEVYDVMILSYKDLDRLERNIFLDIACFFNGLNLKVDYIKVLLKDCESDRSVTVGLERLKDKALITISEDNVVSMHDTIQEMAREVVRRASSKDPRKRSRLWDQDEICDVLKNEKGTEDVRSISLDLSAIKKLELSPHVFAKMTNLQFLDFHGRHDQDCLDLLPQGLQSFPSDLRYLHWMHYPLKSFPEKFSAKNLVILDLSYSRVEELWYGIKSLVNLKEVILYRSKVLKELPDFSKATHLEVLDISRCYNLKSIHPSIFSLENLVRLNLEFCSSLTKFESDTRLSSLRCLNLGYCKKLRTFSVTTNSLIELDLTGIRINALPSSFGCLSKLEMLALGESKIESIPSSIKNLTRLRKLDLRLCSEVLALPALPSSLETLIAEGESLKTVLFPSTASEQFKENKKGVEFWNCSNLDKRSLINIGLNVQINIVKFAYQHLSTLEHDDYVESYDDYKYESPYQAVYVYPGSSVPKWLSYKTTKDEMIVDISPPHFSPLLGFVFCFILAEDSQYCDLMEFNITVFDGEGDGEKDDIDIYMYRTCCYTALDHVCMIYDQPCSQYLTSIAKNQTKFKIKVTARTVSNKYREGPEVKLKGFGISPLKIKMKKLIYTQIYSLIGCSISKSEVAKEVYDKGIAEVKVENEAIGQVLQK